MKVDEEKCPEELERSKSSCLVNQKKLKQEDINPVPINVEASNNTHSSNSTNKCDENLENCLKLAESNCQSCLDKHVKNGLCETRFKNAKCPNSGNIILYNLFTLGISFILMMII